MQVEFYHTFNILSHHINFTGQWNHYPNKGLLSNHLAGVKGKSVLEVACRDGWYSLLFEELGASDVHAIDVEDRDARRYVWNKVGTKATFSKRNVYTLADMPAPLQAQVVFTGDLLCHLSYPLRALEGLHNACTEACYLVCDVWPRTEVLTPDYPNRWTESDLIKLMRLAQFDKIDKLCEFTLHSDYWKSKGCLPSRNLSLFRCERNPNFVPPTPMDFTVDGCPNGIPELTYEVEV